MSKPPNKKITIFLSLEPDIFKGYFNAQDPAPLYKRQLSHEFEQYIMTCIKTCKRDSSFTYKISYQDDDHKQYAEPLAYAIRRHFGETKATATAAFDKFKKKTYILLFMSMAVVMICQGFLPCHPQRRPACPQPSTAWRGPTSPRNRPSRLHWPRRPSSPCCCSGSAKARPACCRRR